MIKIITQSEKDLLLRPGIDKLFYDKEDLNRYFIALIIEEADDFININVEETAYKYFEQSDNIWYLKTDEANTYLKIVLSEFETDPITADYLNSVIIENEEGINEVLEYLSKPTHNDNIDEMFDL